MRAMKKTIALVAAGAALLLAGCSGGGGQSSSDGAPAAENAEKGVFEFQKIRFHGKLKAIEI